MPVATPYALNAYARVGMESGVQGASAHQLVLMLFEGAIVAVTEAKRHMQNASIAAKGASIAKASMIINDGLKASLDINAGGPLAQNLQALYEYMSNRLLVANAKNDPAALDEIRQLLTELKEAWAAINKPQASTSAPMQRPAAPVVYRV